MNARRPAFRLSLGAVLAVCVGTVGCLPPPSTPPFRPAAAGAGFVWETPGLLRRVVADGTVTVQFRRSRGGLRVYGPQMERLGRVRPTLTGWVVYRRDGTAVARATVVPDGWQVRCEAGELVLPVRGATVTLPGGTVQAPVVGRDSMVQTWEAVAATLAADAPTSTCLASDPHLVTALLVHLLAFAPAPAGATDPDDGSSPPT